MEKNICMILILMMCIVAIVPVCAEDTPDTANTVLVVYFSCTGTTKAVAENIALVTGAEIFEITPEIPYTDADLNYHDNQSRANQEMSDPEARPTISNEVEAMDKYSTIYLGYPIWWGNAPRIISTFLEDYDMSGKTIITFCTSGSSSIIGSMDTIRALCPNSTVIDGKRLNGATTEQISQWLSELAQEYDE